MRKKQPLLKMQVPCNKPPQQGFAALPMSEENLLKMSGGNLAVTLLDSLGDAIIVIDEEGRIMLLNPLAQQLTGWAQAEAAGRPVTEVFNTIDLHTRQASLIPPVIETLKNAIPYGRLEPSLLIARDGSEHMVSDHCAPIRTGKGRVGGALLAFRDVREEYAARQALQESNTLVQAILNTVADAIITLRAQDGIVETANFAAQRMFGYNATEITGQNISVLIPAWANDHNPAAWKNYCAMVTVLTPYRARGQLRHEAIGRRQDGSVFPLEIEATEMKLSGQRYFVGVLRDITLRKQIEAEREMLGNLTGQPVGHQPQGVHADVLLNAGHDMTEQQCLDYVLQYKNAELEIARAAAKKASLVKSDFLSKMSHELRTPLNAILGFAQLLESGNPPPTEVQAMRLQQIIKAGWHLLSLINEILDLAVIESGKLPLSQEIVPLQQVLTECQALIQADAQKRDVYLDFMPCNSTWFVYGDRKRIKQVLLNLLFNAVKYNRQHGTVTVRCTTQSERIRITITDTGAGMSPEKIAQLFQPFNWLGQENGAAEGTGIGLVMAKRLVELMGGTIGVASTVGAGSEFWIELGWDSPAKVPDQAVALVPPPATQSGSLLYVENNPANLLSMQRIMQQQPGLHLSSTGDDKLCVALEKTG